MTTTTNFSIAGRDLTRLVRELVREGQWRHALNTLVDGLDGMTHDLALAVLKGEKRLAGVDNELHDEDEDPQVREQLQASYNEALLANTLTLGKKHYRAYALVTALGSKDYFAAKERHDMFGSRAYLDQLPTLPTLDEAFNAERALQYADNLQTDIALRVLNGKEGYGWVLLSFDSTAGDLPLWMSPNTKVEQLAQDGSYYLPIRRFIEPPPLPKEEVTAKPESVASAEPDSADTKPRAYRREAELSRAREFEERIERIRARITAFADQDTEFGWHEFRYHDEERNRYLTLRAPKRALLAYSLSRTAGAHLAPSYDHISESGLKMIVDNPLHTDVWLGCGLSLDDSVYDRDSLEHRAFMEMMFTVQKEMLGYEFQVLTSGGQTQFYGTVVGPEARNIDERNILLVPHAGVEFDLQARQAGAIICESGGRLAHLVTVCREDNKPIVRVPDAMKILKPGMRVMLNLDKGKLDISSV